MAQTTVLFLTSDPMDASPLRLGAEIRDVLHEIRLSEQHPDFELRMEFCVRPADFSRALLSHRPDIVHFSGHGTPTGQLCLEDESGNTRPVTADAFAAVFAVAADHVKCVLLNACFSEIPAAAIARSIPYVVGMNAAIDDASAAAFAVGFYQAVLAGRSYRHAFDLGCAQIRLRGLAGHGTPVFFSPPTLPTNRDNADNVLSAFVRVGKGVLARNVSDESWIPRGAESLLNAWIADENARVACVLGEPGCGKTALLARVASESIERGYATLALKADLVATDVAFDDWLREQLALDTHPLDAIRQAALSRPVLIVVDQLDALADLVDLRSDRLNDLLSFVDNCLKIIGVRVVCSCREFEFRHDTRLSMLSAHELRLELPTWNDVLPQLKRHGLAGAEQWPEAFRTILRTPQHLQIFLDRVRETGQSRVFESYQQMLDDLWRRHAESAARRDLLYQLTEELIERESLWVPEVRFEADVRTIRELEAAGILLHQEAQIGFRHQTLLEYAKGRLFAKNGQSLAGHVRARQDAILVRPTLWYVLQYLRAADDSKYARELDDLFSSELRLHIRYLLIDFLGRQPDPREHEVVHLAARLRNPEDRGRALLAVRGNEAWFRQLRASQFPAAMRWEPEALWPMASVLVAAWPFAREDCLDLIRRYWLDDPAMDGLTVQTLRNLGEWDERVVEDACRIVSRATAERIWWAEDLANVISSAAPTLAPRFVRDALERSAAVKQEAARAISESSQGTEERTRLYQLTQSPLRDASEWYELPAIAEAAPVAFLESLWDLSVEYATKFHGGSPGSVRRVYEGDGRFLEESEDRIEYPLAIALRQAVEGAAKADPEGFVEITRPSWAVENMAVHSLIAHGFTTQGASLARVGLEYLCADPRRFAIGNLDVGTEGYSIRLISAIAPSLSGEGLSRLEKAILGWSQYREDVFPERDQLIWDREARLRLLKAIPEVRLSPSVAEFARREEEQLPEWRDRGIYRDRWGRVREIPPLTKELMLTASDEEVLDALSGPEHGNREDNEWSESERVWTRAGGSRAAVEEFRELAKDHPDRAIPVMKKAMAAGIEGPVGDSLHKMAEGPLSDAAGFSLILELSANRTPSEDFRSDASYFLYRRCRKKIGLPDEICKLLDAWLGMPWDGRRDAFTEQPGDRSDERPESVLWGSGGGLLNTDRSFWTLLALTFGYLMREPAACEPWLDALERHVERNASDRTWKAFCSELRWVTLKGCDRARGTRVIQHLFERYPSVRRSDEGIKLVAMIAYGFSEAFLRAYLAELRNSGDKRSLQAYAELLTLVTLRDTDHGWAPRVLDEEVRALPSLAADAREAVATGIAFAAARIWDEPEARPAAGRFLRSLAEHATPPVAYAFGNVFWARDDFVDDAESAELLQAIAAHPALLSSPFVSDLVEHLAKLCKYQRTAVLEVSKAIVNRFGSEVGSIASELYASGAQLVNIAMTLQRFRDTRAEGLTLLEDLMRLGIDDAFTLLHDIDLQPQATASAGPARLRKRKRRRRRRREGS